MTKSQELLKEIEELRADNFQEIEKIVKVQKEEYWEKKITDEKWAELEKEFNKKAEKFGKEIKDRILSDLSSWALCPQGFFFTEQAKKKN